jgi:hypothetical protein
MADTTHIGRAYKGRPHKPRKTRVKVDLWCEILGARDRAVGHIQNLTVGGCRILSPSAFPVRDTIQLVLAGSADGPDIHIKAQLRWLSLNPVEGPFEFGCQFVHTGDSAGQVEKILKAEIRRSQPAKPVELRAPVYAKFAGGLDAVRAPGAPTAGELRKVYAAEGLDRLTCGEPGRTTCGEPGRTIKPDPSAPLP